MIEQNHKLMARLPEFYRQLHDEGRFVGDSWKNHVNMVQSFIPDIKDLKVLDYGCGPKGGISVNNWKVTPYDPYIEKFATQPKFKLYDLFFCCDVLEHVPFCEIKKVMKYITESKVRYLYLAISTRPANKVFSNGTNVHITLCSADWWHGFFMGSLPNHEVVHAINNIVLGEIILFLKYKFQETTHAN